MGSGSGFDPRRSKWFFFIFCFFFLNFISLLDFILTYIIAARRKEALV